jgi:hypothetical protein
LCRHTCLIRVDIPAAIESVSCHSPDQRVAGGGINKRPSHNAAKQHLGLIAPAGHGARRACVNRAAPSGMAVGSPEGGRGKPPGVHKKNESSPLEQSLQGLECLRDPPGTDFSMIWCLLRTVGVVLLYLSVAGKAYWRCGSAVLTELLSFKAPECCAFSCSSKWCSRCKARFLQVP